MEKPTTDPKITLQHAAVRISQAISAGAPQGSIVDVSNPEETDEGFSIGITFKGGYTCEVLVSSF